MNIIPLLKHRYCNPEYEKVTLAAKKNQILDML